MGFKVKIDMSIEMDKTNFNICFPSYKNRTNLSFTGCNTDIKCLEANEELQNYLWVNDYFMGDIIERLENLRDDGIDSVKFYY